MVFTSPVVRQVKPHCTLLKKSYTAGQWCSNFDVFSGIFKKILNLTYKWDKSHMQGKGNLLPYLWDSPADPRTPWNTIWKHRFAEPQSLDVAFINIKYLLYFFRPDSRTAWSTIWPPMVLQNSPHSEWCCLSHYCIYYQVHTHKQTKPFLISCHSFNCIFITERIFYISAWHLYFLSPPLLPTFDGLSQVTSTQFNTY